MILPLLILGGLAALVLTSRPQPQPAPLALPPAPAPSSNPYVANMAMSPAGWPMPYGASAGAPMAGWANAIVPNGRAPGAPAAMVGGGLVMHTGCSCAQTGAPVVVDGAGRAWLMVRH